MIGPLEVILIENEIKAMGKAKKIRPIKLMAKSKVLLKYRAYIRGITYGLV